MQFLVYFFTKIRILQNSYFFADWFYFFTGLKIYFHFIFTKLLWSRCYLLSIENWVQIKTQSHRTFKEAESRFKLTSVQIHEAHVLYYLLYPVIKLDIISNCMMEQIPIWSGHTLKNSLSDDVKSSKATNSRSSNTSVTLYS